MYYINVYIFVQFCINKVNNQSIKNNNNNNFNSNNNDNFNNANNNFNNNNSSNHDSSHTNTIYSSNNKSTFYSSIPGRYYPSNGVITSTDKNYSKYLKHFTGAESIIRIKDFELHTVGFMPLSSNDNLKILSYTIVFCKYFLKHSSAWLFFLIE